MSRKTAIIAIGVSAAIFVLPLLVAAVASATLFLYVVGAAILPVMARVSAALGAIALSFWIARAFLRGDIDMQPALAFVSKWLAPLVSSSPGDAANPRGWRRPNAFWWFYFTAVIWLIQTDPKSAFVLMFVLAPLWSVATVNVGFVHLALEAMSGRISPRWGAAPALWFLGYLALAAFGWHTVDELRTQAAIDNARQTLAFDPSAQALVLGASEGAFETSQRPEADVLLLRYRLPVVYAVEPSWAEPSAKGARIFAWRLGPESFCQRLRDDAGLKALGARGRTTTVAGVAACLYALPEPPSKPAVTVRTLQKPLGAPGVAGHDTRMRVEAAGGRLDLRHGVAGVYAIFPAPIFECPTLSHGAHCGPHFWATDFRPFGMPAGVADGSALLAHALGLSPRDSAPELAPPPVENAAAPHEATALAALDRLLAAPTGERVVLNVELLTAHPDGLTSRADRIADAAAVASATPAAFPNACTLDPVLASLNDAEFAEAAPRFLARVGGLSGAVRLCSVRLIERLADFGPEGLSVLERAFVGGNGPAPVSIALAFCRMGAPALAVTAKNAELLMGAHHPYRNDLELAKAMALALMRQGRPDLAEKLRRHYLDWADEVRSERAVTVKAWSAGGDPLQMGVTPASPREICQSSAYR